MTLEEIIARLQGVHGSGAQYTARCPAHDDKNASLSIARGKDGRILFHCHAGCSTENIVSALGLTMQDLYCKPDASAQQKPTRKVIAYYDYKDAQGKLVAQKLRYEPKSFSWRRPDGRGGWEYNRHGVDIPLYGADKLTTDHAFVVEGEKDVDTLTRLGKPAVCSPDGAGHGKWLAQYSKVLKDMYVYIIQDNDTIGKEYALEIGNSLYGVAASVQLIDLSTVWHAIPEHADITDLSNVVGDEGTTKLLDKLIRETSIFVPTVATVGTVATVDTVGEDEPKRLTVVSAPDLQTKDIPPIQFVVQKLLAYGLNLLASPPKYGKSWLVLTLCLSVAFGESFLGYQTNKAGCLYLALEDSERRLKYRMNKILGNRRAPDNFYYATSAHDLDNGLLDELDDFVSKHPETKLVVIDTLQKIRSPGGGKDVYGKDYRDTSALKKFADTHNLCMLMVHHLRKMQSIGDPFERISGTNGLMGAADTTIVMTRENRNDEDTLLSVVGRDVDSSETYISFDKHTCTWTAKGDADFLTRERARLEYQNNPIVKTIKKLLEQGNGKWDGTCKDLLQAGRFIVQTYIAPTTEKLSREIQLLEKPLFDYDKIMHSTQRNGNGGRRHYFSYPVDDEQFTEMEQGEIPFE